MLSPMVGPLAAAMALTVSACGGIDAAGASTVAVRFIQQASQDPAAACSLLAPATVQELEENAEKPCSQALSELGIDPSRGTPRTQAFGTDAQVALPNQTVFLARFDEGWKVVAAGCTSGGSDQDVPYTCRLKGR